MIKRNNSFKSGIVNANVGLEPTSAASANNNINNNIYIKTPYATENVIRTTPSNFTERDIKLNDIENEPVSVIIDSNQPHENVAGGNTNAYDNDSIKSLILETFAQILLTQDKALIANLITKKSIIVPIGALQEIISKLVDGEVEIEFDEDIDCCMAKGSPIRRINYIKIVKDSGEIVTDFKTVYNKEWNELVNKYHLCLKYILL